MGICCKGEVHYVAGVIFLIHHDRVRLVRSRNEVRVNNPELSTISQVQNERYEPAVNEARIVFRQLSCLYS